MSAIYYGADSLPRVVLSLARGVEDMYRLPQKVPFIVNASHMLALRTTNEGKNYPSKTTGHETESISVKEYLGEIEILKHLRKPYRVALISPPIARPDLDPWVLGALLGDGYIKQVFGSPIQTKKILDALWAEMQRHGLDTLPNTGKGMAHFFSGLRNNPLQP